MNHLYRLVLGGIIVCATLANSAAVELKVGDEAPNFELKGTDGKSYKLSDYKGKSAVVVAWFPKAHTPGCTAQCKSLRTHGDALREFEVAYFTASVDEPKDNKTFADDLGLDFPILSDPSREVALAYGVVDGKQGFARRWTFYIGKNGKILAIDKSVNTGSHGTDVAAKLKELGVEEK